MTGGRRSQSADWRSAWFPRDMDQKFWVVRVAAIIGPLYRPAATQVLSREGSSLTKAEPVMAHRKPVVLALLTGGALLRCD